MTYEYRIGDRIKSRFGAEFEIIDISKINTIRYSHSITYYRIKPITDGVLDGPSWLASNIVYSSYSPSSAAVKLLFDRGSEATKPSYSVRDNKWKVGGLGGD